VGSTVSTLAFWEALRLGPVAVVSPLGGTVGVVTVAIAFVGLGERPAPWQAAAIPVAAIGSVLAATSGHLPRRGGRRWNGPALAVIAVLSYASVVAMISQAEARVGWLTTLTVSRAVAVVLLWALLAGVTLRSARMHRPNRIGIVVPRAAVSGSAKPRRRAVERQILLLLVLGLLDVSSLIALALAVGSGPVWLLGLLISAMPIPGIIAGLTLFHETLRPAQWLGVVLVVAGVALAAVA
jgi:drug/metabolite transporter (DMT)-like permease